MEQLKKDWDLIENCHVSTPVNAITDHLHNEIVFLQMVELHLDPN